MWQTVTWKLKYTRGWNLYKKRFQHKNFQADVFYNVVLIAVTCGILKNCKEQGSWIIWGVEFQVG